MRQYGRSLWLDPGEKEAQDYSLSVVLDVVRRYDIDGVHFDDYFYPYAEQDASGKDIEFPDEQSWRRFGAKRKLTREDWRRENVDLFIQRAYDSIKAEKRWVKFGISPFGIWRPGHPAQIEGLDAYSKLYADSRKWLARGWVDYFAPQLYWAIEPPQQSFPVLLKWWAQQNAKARLLVPGHVFRQRRAPLEAGGNPQPNPPCPLPTRRRGPCPLELEEPHAKERPDRRPGTLCLCSTRADAGLTLAWTRPPAKADSDHRSPPCPGSPRTNLERRQARSGFPLVASNSRRRPMENGNPARRHHKPLLPWSTPGRRRPLRGGPQRQHRPARGRSRAFLARGTARDEGAEASSRVWGIIENWEL